MLSQSSKNTLFLLKYLINTKANRFSDAKICENIAGIEMYIIISDKSIHIYCINDKFIDEVNDLKKDEYIIPFSWLRDNRWRKCIDSIFDFYNKPCKYITFIK